MRRWLKFQLRKYIKPMDKKYAMLQRRRLSLMYFFFAWNLTGLLIYCCIEHSYPMTEKEKKRPAFWYLRLIGAENAEITHYNGFTLKERLRYENYGENVHLLPLDEEPEEPEVHDIIING